MKSILEQLKGHVSAALETAFGEDAAGVDPLVKAAGDPKFGDYQSNVAMGLAKRLGAKPREVAQRVIDALSPAALDIIEPPEIAGPGFINLRLKTAFLQSALEAIPPVAADAPVGRDRLGIDPVDEADRETVVVDYSSPNVAKQMHVGHLRSTVIGDTIVRVLEFEGHEVVRQNHVGDWGTPMGMVVLATWIRLTGNPYERGTPTEEEFEDILRKKSSEITVTSLELIYREIVKECEADRSKFDRVLRLTKALQERHPLPVRLWRFVCDETLRHVDQLYKRLRVGLTREHVRGESFYDPLLSGIVQELTTALESPERMRRDEAARHAATDNVPVACAPGSDQGHLRAVCREDQGALCVFIENADGTPAFKGPQGDPLPMIIQKSDGAYLYSTTDLAALAFRINDFEKQPIRFETSALQEALQSKLQLEATRPALAGRGGLGANRILYVVGAPQKLHFEMLFATVRALGWTRPGDGAREVHLEHVPFGSVLGADRKMLKTRTGENVKLKDLLDEAVQRAEKLVRDSEADPEKRRGFSKEEIEDIAKKVGIGAVKYADLCQNRNTDYVFSWEKMLALQGNTAPYMLYAYARIRSIYRKGAESDESVAGGAPSGIRLEEDAERMLGLSILRLAETLDSVSSSLLPNILCEYLYDLAGRFMAFYESCPVLKAPDAATKASRLRLCELTARALRLGLSLLGIGTLERM